MTRWQMNFVLRLVSNSSRSRPWPKTCWPKPSWQRSLSAAWDRANQRRVELIRKSTRRGLATEEHAELDHLQAELDDRLGRWDDQWLEQVSRLEQSVRNRSDDGK